MFCACLKVRLGMDTVLMASGTSDMVASAKAQRRVGFEAVDISGFGFLAQG